MSQDKRVHYALVRGKITEAPTLARVHSENVFADLFCDSSLSSGSDSLRKAMEVIADAGSGAVVYVSQPYSGVKIPEGEPVSPNMRDYGMGAQILRYLGFKKIRLLTTHVAKHIIPEGFGLEIESEVKI